MSFISQVTNINQNMHIPAYLYAEQVATMKFADELSKLRAEEKELKVPKIKEPEKVTAIDNNNSKREIKEQVTHIDLKG